MERKGEREKERGKQGGGSRSEKERGIGFSQRASLSDMSCLRERQLAMVKWIQNRKATMTTLWGSKEFCFNHRVSGAETVMDIFQFQPKPLTWEFSNGVFMQK